MSEQSYWVARLFYVGFFCTFALKNKLLTHKFQVNANDYTGTAKRDR